MHGDARTMRGEAHAQRGPDGNNGRRGRGPVWAVLYSIVLVTFTTYVLLDTFVIPKVSQTVQTTTTSTLAQTASTTSTASASSSSGTASTAGSSGSSTATSGSSSTPITTGSSYSDDNIQISISTLREYDTDIYVVDIQVSDVSYLQTAFAQNAYGRNIKETTSDIAADHDAILAINGDYYGFRDDGFVLRNGVLYRDTASDGTQALVVSSDGNMYAVDESTTSASDLAAQGIWQVLSFGPVLVSDSQIAVDENTEVDQAMTSNPRTAIGMISPLHYVIVVSDGRTDQSEGLSLYQLAQVFSDQGCTFAYNLDGGGSTTLYFNGEVINNPTTNGKSTGEREVSDIVYVGY